MVQMNYDKIENQHKQTPNESMGCIIEWRSLKQVGNYMIQIGPNVHHLNLAPIVILHG